MDALGSEIEARCRSAEQALRVTCDLLRRAVVAIERGELALADFASQTASQLQQPLSAVQTFVRTLQVGAGLTPHELLAFAERIDAGAQRAQEQIAELRAQADRTNTRPPESPRVLARPRSCDSPAAPR